MAYERFLSYFFAYEGDEKRENCGFAKVEARGETRRLQIVLKRKGNVELLHVCGFYREMDRCICVPLGRMLVNGGSGQFQYVIHDASAALDGPIVFDQLKGIVISNPKEEGRACATVWDDEVFGLSMFRQEEEQDPEYESVQLQEAGKQESEYENVQLQEVEKQEPDHSPLHNEVQTQEEPQEEWEPFWDALCERFQKIETLPQDELVCLKAVPADIGRLPRQNWMFGNNGFLMYSYVRFRYIVFACPQKGTYELWVPGTYENNEELLAEMFGFHQFRSAKSAKAQIGDFGYWCAPIVGLSAQTEKETTEKRMKHDGTGTDRQTLYETGNYTG